VTTPHAIAKLADLVAVSHPHDPNAFDTIAQALETTFPDAAEKARITACLLRESERAQLSFSQILEDATARNQPSTLIHQHLE
jgi:hypothetical protein